MSDKRSEGESAKGWYLIGLASAAAYGVVPVLIGSALMRAPAGVVVAGTGIFAGLATLLLVWGIVILRRSRRQ